MKILVQWPTRGRHEKILDRVAAWHAAESQRASVAYQIVYDADDAPTRTLLHNHRSSLDRLRATAIESRTPTKIGAYATGLNPGEWDVLVLGADDFVDPVPGWDQVIRRAMEQHFPGRDGLLHFSDGRVGDRLCTLPAVGNNLFRRLGHAYFPQYQSFFCDDELMECAVRLRRHQYIDLVLARHDFRGSDRDADATYQRAKPSWMHDQNLFHARSQGSFGLVQPILSVLVPTIWERMESCQRLVEELYRQVWALPRGAAVEICVRRDQRGAQPVGAKRNAMLLHSNGRYVAFVDDDDRVAPDYLSSILAAIDATPGVDCVTFAGEFRQDGGPASLFDFDLAHKAHINRPGGVMDRMVNHLCPVRRDLALDAQFPLANRSEDTAYAQRLLPLLKNQAVCRDEAGKKKILYFYDFSPAHSATQGPHNVAATVPELKREFAAAHLARLNGWKRGAK